MKHNIGQLLSKIGIYTTCAIFVAGTAILAVESFKKLATNDVVESEEQYDENILTKEYWVGLLTFE